MPAPVNRFSRRAALTSMASMASMALMLSACSEHGVPKKLKVGDAVPASRNRILEPGADPRSVTTMDTRVRLYRWRIADMIEQKRPFMVVFGTPQHCTICVDQMARIAQVEEKYGERFAFIHVDGYKDNAIWVDWGVKGEPWTFVVDRRGRVRQVFSGQTEISLLEDQVKSLLAGAA
jgi:thiol-disulfide isomerase/thioredoxin